MATAAEQLQQILDDVARSGALTAAAIKQFDDYRKRVEDLEKVNAEHEKWRAWAGKELERLRGEVTAKDGQIAGLRAENDALKAKEREADKAKWIAEFEKERRTEMRSILSDVFRNVEVHRSIARNVVIPPVPPNQYNTCGTPPYAETVTDTETVREG